MKKILPILLTVALCWLALMPLSVQGQRPATPQAAGKFHKARQPISNRYIVVFKDEVERSKVPSLAAKLAGTHGGKILYVYGYVLKGFAARLSKAGALALSRNPQVKYVEEDSMFTVIGSQATPQSSSFYGISRLDQRFGLDETYVYNRVGNGVHVYVLDTGVRTTHKQFGTRADVFRDLIGGAVVNNHGTFVAGVIGAKDYGVAKNVEIHSVRVCLENGQCPGSTVAQGLDQVTQFGSRPAVVNMSFAGHIPLQNQSSMEAAIQRAINAGITCVAGSGDSTDNASQYSPARLTNLITVGATDKFDNIASYSNFGSVVDLFAPGGEAVAGQFIPTPSAASDSEIDGFTGTSASSPHVAGVAALYLEFDPTASHFIVRDQLVNNATDGVVTNVPFGTTTRMTYAGFIPAPTSNPVDDARVFVRQQYYDFLRKQPDQSGWDFWTGQITQCSDPNNRAPGETEAQCVARKRVDVARAFWESDEFRLQPITAGLVNGAPPPEYINSKFIELCYRIYLQRFPDDPPDNNLNGFNFWLGNLNNCTNSGGDFGCYHGIIQAFIESSEYRARFQ